MKQLFLLLIISISFGSANINAQWGNNSGTLSSGKDADLKWEKKVIDIGEVKQYEPIDVIYKFTNIGGKPIIITNAKGSCGCTDIQYSKKPILPGESTSVLVNFDAADLGVFNKTITLTMNIENSSQVVHLKGAVIK